MLFDNCGKEIQLPELRPGEIVQVPFTALIANAATAKLNNRVLGNISVSGQQTYSIQGQAYSIQGQALTGTTTTLISVTYARPTDLRLPTIEYVNDELDGNLRDLEYQGSSYRLNVVTNRDVLFTVDHDPAREADLHALPLWVEGPDAASLLTENLPYAFWGTTFNGTLPLALAAQGDLLSFDIDGLQQSLESRLCPDPENPVQGPAFLKTSHSIGFTGQWADRQLPDTTVTDTYLIPISVTTIREKEIVTSSCVSCGSLDWRLPGGGDSVYTPALKIPEGEVKIEITQRIGLEREAFDIAMAITPSVDQLDNVAVTL